ncbi:hypothetical protein Y1Q_0010046 [Alligator mississippiensis]|uniref:Uncharacterized protein n=1 Tax=Alligator mississippiensis TaxID=8496 RepID=A0A151NN09_ALLMI|nr:hypothetical protein Y1Q_0010046 [Alligator mississippiensis]
MLVEVVLVLVLLAPGATPCLGCWPDTPLYFDYDVRLLLGDSLLEGATRLDKKLHELFLDRENPGIQVMEQERMEREAGKLFYHLDRIFTRYRHDPERLLKEAELERRNFTLRLKAATAAVLQQGAAVIVGAVLGTLGAALALAAAAW